MKRLGCSVLVVLVAAVLAAVVLQARAERRKSKEDLHENANDGSRIVGGDSTSIDKFPWQVLIYIKHDNWGGCGGSIISMSWIMSAAHCFTEDLKTDQGKHDGFKVSATRIHIYAGVADRTKRRTDPNRQINEIPKTEIGKQLFIHPDYNKVFRLHSDIALIKLKNPLHETKYVKQISLAKPSDFILGKNLIASGWGRTNPSTAATPNILQYVSGLKLISQGTCSHAWRRSHKITESMICHTTPNICTGRGDSGGPVITGSDKSNGPPYVQIGIVSFISYRCGDGVPGVCTNVSRFTNWINDITGVVHFDDVSFTRGVARSTDSWSNGKHEPTNAFGGSGFWHSGLPLTVPKLLWYEFPEAIRVVKYSFTSRGDFPRLTPTDGPSKYIFWASNHHDCTQESRWVKLHLDNSGTPFERSNEPKTVHINNNRSYRCYGFKVTDTPGRIVNGAGVKAVAIGNVHFYSTHGL